MYGDHYRAAGASGRWSNTGTQPRTHTQVIKFYCASESGSKLLDKEWLNYCLMIDSLSPYFSSLPPSSPLYLFSSVFAFHHIFSLFSSIYTLISPRFHFLLLWCRPPPSRLLPQGLTRANMNVVCFAMCFSYREIMCYVCLANSFLSLDFVD